MPQTQTTPTDLTPGQQAAIDYMRKYGGESGRLAIWPGITTYQDIVDLEAKGIIYHKFYGPATYGHTDYFLTQTNER